MNCRGIVRELSNYLDEALDASLRQSLNSSGALRRLPSAGGHHKKDHPNLLQFGSAASFRGCAQPPARCFAQAPWPPQRLSSTRFIFAPEVHPLAHISLERQLINAASSRYVLNRNAVGLE